MAPDTFREDVRLCFALLEVAGGSGTSSADETWIPERLFLRMLHLAEAYHLHALGVVRSDLDTHLNDVQCQSLLPELEFLANLVPSDMALRPVLAEVSRLAARAARSGGKAELLVELP